MARGDDWSVALGRGVRSERLRQGLTVEDLAASAREAGVSWSASTVNDLEAGRRSATLSTIVTAALALRRGNPSLRLADLFPVSGKDLPLGRGAVRPALVNSALAGHPVGDWPGRVSEQRAQSIKHNVQDLVSKLAAAGLQDLALSEVGEIQADAERDATANAGRVLGVSPLQVSMAAFRRWGHGFVTERDRRAGADAVAQRRGIVTRQLVAELRGTDHGDD